MEHESPQSEPEPAASSPAVPSRREAAGEGQGGLFNNIPPSIPSFEKCLGGEDWLELALYLEHRNFWRLKARLDEAREAAESNLPAGDVLEIAGRKFLMLPLGANAGSTKKQVVYRWRLRSEDGWWLLLMNREQSHKTMPTGIARASSLALLRIGPAAFLRQLEETLRAIGIRLLRSKLSRVDPCVDLSDVSIDGLYQAFMQGHHVSRARFSSDHLLEESIEGYRLGRRPTGFQFGQGDILLRVYDKFHKSKNDSEMLLLMQTRRWGEIGGPSAIRVEFQLRRDKLKPLGIDIVEDWWLNRGAVTHYLCHEWCRITAHAVDPKHPERATTHPDWIKVQEAFGHWSGKPLGELAPLPRLPIRADHLIQQIIGTLVSYHARVGNQIDSNESFVDESIEAMWETIEPRDMAREVYRRGIESGAAPQ